MKKAIILALGISVFFACQNKQKNDSQTMADSASAYKPTSDKFPVMQADSQSVDLGVITQGDTIIHIYKFRNTGNMPLVLSSVNASCGCTTPSYSTSPVQPGEQGFIKVKFDSKGKEGKLSKTVTAIANTTPAENTFSFKVEVLKK
ncbi:MULTISPECIES: DUF1573 domain-containing protein [unclassified Arcicella]|uniref:DUF1573 domain-containing protein n=1 Tax=unclassified Arcicella TaxID=2644986 RepID=UPI0028641F51|nr:MULTISPECIES: DUF1573 domain-containing protein [unclassified Arcicella]MDR6560977.1 hypothetical protein [Arcicella sp. BE51]MDR6810861.1 hypothetical protein [Arcicella sp. BE140]MDR6822211.1 hypothetical protein [Arcicella sp. BE139]